MRKGFVVLFLVVILTFQGCATPKNKSTNIADYGLWKGSTKSILAESFNNSLPATQIVYDYGNAYYYNCSQSLMGDENFVLIVDLKFDDNDEYRRELEKYAMFSESAVNNNNITWFIIQGTSEKIEEYCDTKIYDGMFYDFEIIGTNEDDFSISFINAHVWDYYSDQALAQRLQQIEGQGDGSSP